jgi:E3 ubiquitin-protein ligase RFWD2
MSGVKRTRTDEIASSQSQTTATTTTTTTTISPKIETASVLKSNIEEDYNCPICFELINEAFVSRCGHSFCSKCLQRTVESLRRCPKCQLSLQPSDIFPNYTLNAIIEKYRQQRPLPQTFGKYGSIVEHISDMVTNVHALNTEDLDRLMFVIRQHKDKLDSNSDYVHNRLLEIFLMHVHHERSGAIESLTKELNIVDLDLKQMNKRQKCSSLLSNVNNSANSNSNENPILSSNSTNDIKEDSSSASQDTTIVNDTVPNWTQSGGQDLRATPDMKTDKQQVASSSSSMLSTTTTKNEIAPGGAVVPEETNQNGLMSNDEVENRTKIMMRFMDDLTNIYFSTRNSLRLTVENDGSCNGDSGLRTFRDNLAAVTKYSRCKPIATVNFVGENFAQASIVSSIEFDRDYEHFAVAGVSKKIKLYEYQSILDNTVDLHYPTKEVLCTAKLSCISWNPYLRNYLASSDYDGFVSIWDMATAQKVRTFQEHEKRSWSVDFCSADPKLLASCSDDCRVKIWSMHNDYSVTTIDAKSNVCCVKFKPDSQYNIVFGTADHNLYYFDLRNTREPCNLLKGHKKAVSYARFLSNNEIVSASTDSQLRLWRVTEGQCLRTYRGHVNEKNFVGLAVSSGYIVCGSESNTVHLYQREISRPLLNYKFDDQNNGTAKTTTATTTTTTAATTTTATNPDRVKKEETGTEFVSAMCWSNRENVLLAANSQGVVKVLELV